MNPRFNPGRFTVEGRHSSLTTAAAEGDGRFTAQVSPGFDQEVPRLTQILKRPKGLPPPPPGLI